MTRAQPTPPTYIPVGKVFTEDDILVYADRENRTLDQAISDADLLVSCPHASAAIPAELKPYIAPELTERLQYDFSDMATDKIMRRWAEIDPRVIGVINPHPRLVRDPNRHKPANIAEDFETALARSRAAGPWQPVDLTSVDAIRPCTFSFFPIIKMPTDNAGIRDLIAAFVEVAGHGLGVYEHLRDELTERFITKTLASGGTFTRLAFHDTMNTTARRDGAVVEPRLPQDQLPQLVALSNRGDAYGNQRTSDDPVTMAPRRIRALAEAHRAGFDVTDRGEVALNKPYLGSEEIIAARNRFAEISDQAKAAEAVFDAVQAEFLREFLLGDGAVAELHRPGTAWVTEDPDHIDYLAQCCKRSWDIYRNRGD